MARTAPPETSTVASLKVTLRGTKPPICIGIAAPNVLSPGRSDLSPHRDHVAPGLL
jgi:hypothetical protein